MDSEASANDVVATLHSLRGKIAACLEGSSWLVARKKP